MICNYGLPVHLGNKILAFDEEQGCQWASLMRTMCYLQDQRSQNITHWRAAVMESYSPPPHGLLAYGLPMGIRLASMGNNVDICSDSIASYILIPGPERVTFVIIMCCSVTETELPIPI